ncbi:hypothetical protein D3C83_126800 [compost metagenome]
MKKNAPKRKPFASSGLPRSAYARKRNSARKKLKKNYSEKRLTKNFALKKRKMKFVAGSTRPGVKQPRRKLLKQPMIRNPLKFS